ncbi:MAG TPA: cation diffusion facilitator family transporter [Candidatus Bathyarchaeia archaeon]|nr:cation diffusion facilitator family transporter [Candidatus Bathyarchaeia archaeon]
MKKKRAARIALFGGIAVLGIKLLAFLLSNSVALLSDALESIVNIGASGLMLFSVYVSEKPADESHDYGHQKIEDISSMVEGIFIIAAALLIIYSAVGRLFEFSALFELNLAIIVSMLATGLNGGISWFLTRTSRETKSSALEGDAKHLLSDVISSAGIWVGLFVVQLTGWNFMDSVMAFVVAGLVAKMGAGLVIKSSHLLMDKSCEEEEKKISEILDRHRSQFVEFHNLRTRRQGNQVFGDLHLTVDGSLSVKDAHDFTDHLERNLKEKIPYLDLTIHVETRD